MKILIVDDNQDSVEYVSRILEGHCEKIFKAYNGQSAISIAKEERPDLILLDLMLPDIDGFKVCEVLTNDPGMGAIPIIMVTARTDVKDLQKGFEMGAYDYLRKPFDTMELLSRVKAALKFSKNQSELIDAKKRLEDMNAELAKLAVTDSLTQTYNHTFLINSLKHEMDRAKRFSYNMAFLMLDIDHFKKINDTYGHLVGDEVLKEVVKITQTPIRSIDILGRYGGEEFGLILPETNEKGAMTLAEKIRKNIDECNFVIKSAGNSVKIKLTVSIGVAIYPDEDVNDVLSLIRCADRALYTSKDSGRNRVYKFKHVRIKEENL